MIVVNIVIFEKMRLVLLSNFYKLKRYKTKIIIIFYKKYFNKIDGINLSDSRGKCEICDKI